MAEILFYHLTESALEQVLPQLLERSLARGWNAAVQCPDEGDCRRLDALLWGFDDRSFLPHSTEFDPYPEAQPALLGLTDDNRNNAQVCFCVDGALAQRPDNFSRLCIIFDGHNAEQVQAARAAWKKWQAETEKDAPKYQLTYWQQTPERKWQKRG